VRDNSVAEDLSKAVGHRVQLHYTEHPGIPTSCFAETRFLVDKVTVTDNAPGNQATPGPASGAPGATGAPPATGVPANPSAAPASPAPTPTSP
jgi:hypothetical protein